MHITPQKSSKQTYNPNPTNNYCYLRILEKFFQVLIYPQLLLAAAVAASDLLN